MLESSNNISYYNHYKCIQCINSTTCKHITRKSFINNCLPFYDLTKNNFNILNFNQNGYIYYDKKNKYNRYLDNNFIIQQITKVLPEKQIYNKELLINKITNTFDNIPIYLLFSDYNIIFNIFIFKYNEKINDTEKIILDNKNTIKQIKDQIYCLKNYISSSEYQSIIDNNNLFPITNLENEIILLNEKKILLENELQTLKDIQRENEFKKNIDEITEKIKEIPKQLDKLNIIKQLNSILDNKKYNSSTDSITDSKLIYTIKYNTILYSSINKLEQLQDQKNELIKQKNDTKKKYKEIIILIKTKIDTIQKKINELKIPKLNLKKKQKEKKTQEREQEINDIEEQINYYKKQIENEKDKLLDIQNNINEYDKYTSTIDKIKYDIHLLMINTEYKNTFNKLIQKISFKTQQEEQQIINDINEKEYKKNIIFQLNNEILELQEEININTKDNELRTNILPNIFKLDDNNNFLSISFKFNILNISLLCEKYFEIIKLITDNSFIDLNTIKQIFNNFNLLGIYYLINKYKYKIENTNIDSQILNNQFKNNSQIINNISNQKLRQSDDEYNLLINVEKNMNNLENIEKKNTIYNNLVAELLIIKTVLESIDIPYFTEAFFMAILSYKFKNNLLNNTWGFNTNYIYSYINNNNKRLIKSSIKNKIVYEKYLNLFLDTKLIIYEYVKVYYKYIKYGNCMENTILQFLKVIFWDNDNNVYNFELINKIIKPDILDKINYFFININYERSEQYTLNWVEFITELPTNYSYNYDLINVVQQIELNSTLNNLIIALRILTNYENEFIDDNILFMEYIIKNINETYSININTEQQNIDIIELDLYKLYTITLNHNIHARFNKINANNYFNNYENNSLDSFSYFINDKSTKQNIIYISEIYGNLNAYMFYIFAENNIYYNYIINYIPSYELEILTNNLFNNYEILTDNLKIKLESNVLFIKLIPQNIFINYINDYTNTLWITIYNNRNKFNINILIITYLTALEENKEILQTPQSQELYAIFLKKKYTSSLFNDVTNQEWIQLIENYHNDDVFCSTFMSDNLNILEYLNDEILSSCELQYYFWDIDEAYHNKILQEKNIIINDWETFFITHYIISDRYIDYFIKNSSFNFWEINEWKRFFILLRSSNDNKLIFFMNTISQYINPVNNINIIINEYIEDKYDIPDIFRDKIIITCIFLNLDKYNLTDIFIEYIITNIDVFNYINFNKREFINKFENSKYYNQEINNQLLRDIILTNKNFII